jgi:hypothetical protein
VIASAVFIAEQMIFLLTKRELAQIIIKTKFE